MNGDSLAKQPPELTDDDIRVLDTICKRAARLRSPPYQSLYACYDAVLKEQGLEERHDNILFRWLHSITDVVDKARQDGSEITIIEAFRELLTDYGITIVDDDSEEEHVFDILEGSRRRTHARGGHNVRRRVSFDDARYEESWLTTHSQTLHASAPEPQLPPSLSTRSRKEHGSHRTRAKSVPSGHVRDAVVYRSVVQPRSVANEEFNEPLNEALQSMGELTLEDLEEQANAAFDMKILKTARQVLRLWRRALNAANQQREEDGAIASQHDFRVLSKQVFDTWLLKARVRRGRREDEARQGAAEALLARSHLDPRRRVIRQWLSRLNDVDTIMTETREHMLRFRYFLRWKTIAVENATKLRLILTRKFFLRWHDLSLERRMNPASVERLNRRLVLRGCLRSWRHKMQEALADRFCRHNVQHRTLLRWSSACRSIDQAQHRAASIDLTRAMLLLNKRFRDHQEVFHDRIAEHESSLAASLKQKAFNTIRKTQSLNADQRTYEGDLNKYIIRKAWETWHEELERAKKARRFRHEQLLRTSWTALNDTLRVTGLSNQIDERVKGDCLYRLVLEERLRLYRRRLDTHLQRRTLIALHQNLASQQPSLQQQSAAYAEAAQRRTLSRTFQRLHIVLRKREDAGRVAIELGNTRLLPKVILTWQRHSSHVQTIQKWAGDAQFFVFTTKYVGLWKTRTSESMKNKRRIAYEHVRERVKTRNVRSCLAIWRSKATYTQSMQHDAKLYDQARIRTAVQHSLKKIQRQNNHLVVQYQQATNHDLLKLQHSALTLLESRQGHLTQDEELAVAFRSEVDQAVLAIILKRLRFATFTAARLDDNSRMLRERLTQHRHRQILRYLSVTATDRQTARQEETEVFDRDPESPSTRPAFRAASRSASRPASVRRATIEQIHDTPAYLRTPARGRRGRFRAIPTPAPYTPFTFTPGVLASTPFQPRDATDDSVLTDPQASTPQVTPFERKLRAGGISNVGSLASSLRRSVLSRSIGTGSMSTGKSVRFLGSNSKFRGGDRGAG